MNCGCPMLPSGVVLHTVSCQRAHKVPPYDQPDVPFRIVGVEGTWTVAT